MHGGIANLHRKERGLRHPLRDHQRCRWGWGRCNGDGAVSSQCFNTSDDGSELRGDDCNDVRGDTFPLAEEICDQVDNDCDGTVDEGVTLPGFVDSDGDGDGNAAEPIMAGEVWCWGQGTSGALGNGASEDAYEAVRTMLPMAAKSVSYSGDSGCALLVDDSVWCWGNDTNGECGQRRNLEVFETPVRVMGL